MISKKGIETVVAWVLILGFSILLGTIVFLWSTRMAKDLTGETKNYIEGGMMCDNVQLYAYFTPLEGDDTYTCAYLHIENRGYINITKIKVNAINKGTNEPLSVYIEDPIFVPLTPRVEKSGLTAAWLPNNNMRVELIPVVENEKNFVGCPTRKVVVEC